MTSGTDARAGADADAIELVDVTEAFGGLTALAGVSLSLRHRSRTGIVGSSGGGKTTLPFGALEGGGPPTGCLDLAAWRDFGNWLKANQPVHDTPDAAAVMTDKYLPHPSCPGQG
jgi:hypothetical protein